MLDSRYFIKLSNNVVYKKMDQDIILLLVQTLLNLENVFFFSSDPKSYISMVPTSAHTGEGMGNLMALLVKLSQDMLAKRLAFSQEMQATVLEVKAIPGLGTTIDIVLLNGSLREGQTMIVAGTDGPIVTVIKALLTPSKMQDLRVKVKLVTWH
jgi:translation initiation factor 5B